MDTTHAIVITSISSPENAVLKTFADGCSKTGARFIVVGDKKSPSGFRLPGCDFWDIGRQATLSLKLAKLLPYGSYARKNLGYLVAMQNGCRIIVETDDDNYPGADFWKDRVRSVPGRIAEYTGWTNVYRYFTDAHIWPRGFPLDRVRDLPPDLGPGSSESLESPIQQGLADENPDVDAVFRLVLPLPLTFRPAPSVALGANAWCPFNSQNTTWFAEAFPLLYLPSYCSFRMTDIWRSFVAQRIAWTCGWRILFHKATVHQERNDHNLMKDFADEVPGYLNNERICQTLGELDLASGVDSIGENLVACYGALVNLGVVGVEELPLVEAWTEDLAG
jgi:hypothetical protein